MTDTPNDSGPLTPSVGWNVLHLFCKLTTQTSGQAIVSAVKESASDDHQVVSFAVLGHKADLGFLALGPDVWHLRRFQAALQRAGLEIVQSYVSLTEVSEYAQGMPQAMLDARLYPNLPPADKRAICFYPMSKRRGAPDQNWFTTSYDERKEMMYEHGASGRKFSGRILQLVTGSTGLDEYEWGVTLFGQRPDDLKETVYTMRYDKASAVYADFGPFYAGVIASPEELVAELRLP